MSARTIHFVYLFRDVVQKPPWAHLHRFLHPGAEKHDGQALMIGSNLDLNYHPYLSIRAAQWGDRRGSQVVLLRHDLVASILEVASHTTQLGFVDLSDARERLVDQPVS